MDCPWKSLRHGRLFVTPWIVHGILQARILDWGAVPFSKGSSQLRDQTQVSCIAGRFFTIWATRKALIDCRCVDLFLGFVILFHLLTYLFFCFCFLLIAGCFDYGSFIALCEVWEGYASCLVLFPQDCFGNSGFFIVPYKFKDYFFEFCEKCHG